MKSIYLRLAVAIAAVVLVASSGTARAQDAVQSGLRANVSISNIVRLAQVPDRPEDPREDAFRGWGRNVLRVGQDYALKQGESVHDAVVVFSPATIDGYVRGDVVVVFGTVQIGATAVINGSLIVVGGNVAVQPGAAVHQDLVVIGGGLDAPTEFNPGGQHIAVGANAIADRLRREFCGSRRACCSDGRLCPGSAGSGASSSSSSWPRWCSLSSSSTPSAPARMRSPRCCSARS